MTRSRSELWQKNFALSLQENIDVRKACSVSQAVGMLHEYFSKVVSGKREPAENDAEVFYAVRNCALSVLSARLHQDTNRSLVMAYDMGVAKNSDYGIDNIPRYGVVGLAVRLNDKFVKAAGLMKGPRMDSREEGLRQVLIDAVNYSTYALMLYKGMWQ